MSKIWTEALKDAFECPQINMIHKLRDDCFKPTIHLRGTVGHHWLDADG